LNKKLIYIYKDEGVGLVNASYLWSELKKAGYDQSHELRWIKKNDLLIEGWENHTAALVMPGGRDVPYHELLKGIPNARIKSFVMNGGTYLGICAGAYYGCSSLEFDLGHPLEVKDKRELKFFPGVAYGPAYGGGTFCYTSSSGARIAKLKMQDQSILASYYNGGCYFADASDYKNVKVVARYLDIPEEPAAIVQCQVGKGVAILSGVHPEVSANGPHSADPFFLKLKPALANVEEHRKTLLQLLFMMSF
jgi:biotin--protein ligase